MKKILITRRIPEIGLKKLVDKNYEIDIGNFKVPPTKKEIIKLLRKKSYDAILTLLTDQIDKEVLDYAPSVKIIANYAVGFNNVDLVEAKKRGIVVTNTPGNISHCVAEHTSAFILALFAKMVEGDSFMRKGKYNGWDPDLFVGSDVRGKTLGLVGLGRIGADTARAMVKGFGMKVIYRDMSRHEDLEKELGAEYIESLDELLSKSDVVSLHVPLTEETKHLINKDTLQKMKKTAFLINTSRGAVVDEKALVEALKNGVIAGAGLDVYEFEPKMARGLAKLSNVILTPHTASARDCARNEMAEIAAANIISFFETGKALNEAK